MWELGIELGSSAITTSALKHRVISATAEFLFLLVTYTNELALYVVNVYFIKPGDSQLITISE